MGQPMPDVPHVYGDDCVPCFDPGKTPKYLWARFSLLEPCPAGQLIPPNDHAFKLTQSVVAPCDFLYTSAKWLIVFSFSFGDPAESVLHLDSAIGRFYFLGTGPECIEEGHVFANAWTVCGPYNGAINGIATITWTQQATDLLESINMQRADDLFMEMRPLMDGNLVYKFCRLQDATNIAIEFEPD